MSWWVWRFFLFSGSSFPRLIRWIWSSPMLSKFNHFLSPLVVSRNWPWLVPWGREKDPSAISMCGTCCELPLEWKTCQRLLGSAWSHSSVVRALLMTSRVPGSCPGGSGVFSLFRLFTSPTDPLNYYYYYYWLVWGKETLLLLLLLLLCISNKNKKVRTNDNNNNNKQEGDKTHLGTSGSCLSAHS